MSPNGCGRAGGAFHQAWDCSCFQGRPHAVGGQSETVRGTARQREVWFAPSSRSSRVRDGAKLKASGVHTSEGVSHVFMNVLAVFAPRLAPGDPPSAMSFKVVSLQASPQAAELETVSLRAIIGGSMVGDAWSVEASTFFLSHVPSVRPRAQLDTPPGDNEHRSARSSLQAHRRRTGSRADAPVVEGGSYDSRRTEAALVHPQVQSVYPSTAAPVL